MTHWRTWWRGWPGRCRHGRGCRSWPGSGWRQAKGGRCRASRTWAATDRYRLAGRELRWEPAHPGLRAIALVPARTLADAARTMTPGEPVPVAFTPGDEPTGQRDPHPVEGMISFECRGRRLTGRLIGGGVIRYPSRFPDGDGCRAGVPAARVIGRR